jgi:hypothetical protein
MRRLLRLAVAILIGVVAWVAVAAGVLVWRLQRGPLPLDFLVPRITASLAEGDDAWRVGIDALELVWQPSARHVELRARGLRVARPDDSASVQLEAVRIRLRRRALLRGEIAVEAIELERPDLHLVRDAAGRFGLQIGTPRDEVRDVGWLTSALGHLEHVAVRDGRIVFVDEASRTTWTVPHVDGDVWRAGGPLRVQLGVSLVAADTTIPLWLSGIYRFEAATLTLEVSTSGADTTAAFAAWPASLAPEAHAWVTTRLADGRIRQSVLAASGHVVRAGDGPKLVLDALDASVAFDGLDVRYVDTMPAATGVGGVARFARDGVTIAVTSGKLDALAIGPASVRIAWPPGAPNRIAIDARTRGPLASLVGVLDHEPIALRERVPLPATGVGGTATARVRLAFPLDRRPVLGKLGLHARATIADATVPDVAGQWSVSGGAATVVVDDRTVAVTGTAELGGVPVRIRFADRLGRAGASRLDVAARLDAAERRALGLVADSWLTGPVDTRVRIAPGRDQRTIAAVDADLAPCALDLPSLALRKPPEASGRMLARLVLARDEVASVEHFQVDAAGVVIRGSAARPAGGGAWDRIDVAAELGAPDQRGAMTLALRAGDRTSSGWQMTLRSPDLGRLLRAYGYENATGGTLALEGTVGLGTDGLPFEGRLTAEQVTLTRVPWLVKAVSLASLRGLLDLGSEQAIAVDRAVATVAHRPPSTIEIRDAVARGPKLGLTVAGRVDHAAGTIDLEGTLVPSYYMLNEGVSSIPVVGGVLGKVTGGAVQAVSFTAKGPRTDPVVAVQPFSSLAPGVVRDWLRKLGL